MAAEFTFITLNNNSAAFDVYQNAAPRTAPQGLPEELPKEGARPSERRRITAAPFTVFAAVAAVLMIVLVVFGYVQLYEATSRAAKLQSDLNDLQRTQAQLLSKYESHINLQEIEKRATELGLSTPRQEQIVYLDLSGEDTAEIYHEKTTGVFTEVVQAVEQSVTELIAYLNPETA